METYLLVLELIGTAAFAVSGALVGIRKNMDLFGVSIVGLMTACGGGLLRDVCMGSLPPVMFQRPVYTLTAIAASLLMMSPAIRRSSAKRPLVSELTMLVSDSVGLGVFTAAGVSAAISAGYGDNPFLVVFLGAITGVGGGLLRDLFTQSLPYIFTKHFYACAAIIGALAGALLWPVLGEALAMPLCAALVFAIRLLAAHYRWKLPKAPAVVTEPETQLEASDETRAS